MRRLGLLLNLMSDDRDLEPGSSTVGQADQWHTDVVNYCLIADRETGLFLYLGVVTAGNL